MNELVPHSEKTSANHDDLTRIAEIEIWQVMENGAKSIYYFTPSEMPLKVGLTKADDGKNIHHCFHGHRSVDVNAGGVDFNIPARAIVKG